MKIIITDNLKELWLSAYGEQGQDMEEIRVRVERHFYKDVKRLKHI